MTPDYQEMARIVMKALMGNDERAKKLVYRLGRKFNLSNQQVCEKLVRLQMGQRV